MKFKLFKKKESSNSVKVLLKKLKRHDTKVVAVAVIIALFLSGGLIYISTPIVATNATEEIAESGRQSNKETAEKLNQINAYLTELDKVVTSNQKSLSTISKNTNITESKETIDATGKATNTIKEKVATLDGSLKDVHTTITSTTSKIEELNKALEKSDTANKQQLEKDFTQVNQDLAKIQTEYEDAKKQNKELIEKLQKEMTDGDKKLGDSSTENHKALLKELETMDKSMEEKNTKTIETFNDNFSTMNSTIVTGFDDLKEYVGNVAGGINGRLDQVFQSVSDGKKLLASTLLTKGINIKEDATFEEISNAIMDIPTTITVQEMTGTVVYDKHFHADGNGTICNEHHVSIDRKGGCYEKPYYHVHDSSCYRTSISYTYYTKAGTHLKHRARKENGVDIFRYECEYCHSSFESTDGEHLEFASTYDQARRREGSGIKEHVNNVLVCGKNGSTLEGYSCGCGYLHGQILAAHIDYSMNKNLKSLPDIEESHIALPAPAGSRALDALMLLTDVDMSTGADDITQGKEISNTDNADNAGITSDEGKENSDQAGEASTVEEDTGNRDVENKDIGNKDASNEGVENKDTENKNVSNKDVSSKEPENGNAETSETSDTTEPLKDSDTESSAQSEISQ